MKEQISSQQVKLTFLQKKVDNISATMSDVSKTLSSLEGKISEDKGRDVQSFLKGKRKKEINTITHPVKGARKNVLMLTSIIVPYLQRELFLCFFWQYNF